jgi:hypothetical protein
VAIITGTEGTSFMMIKDADAALYTFDAVLRELGVDKRPEHAAAIRGLRNWIIRQGDRDSVGEKRTALAYWKQMAQEWGL